MTRVIISLPIGGTMRLTSWSRVTLKKIWLTLLLGWFEKKLSYFK